MFVVANRFDPAVENILNTARAGVGHGEADVAGENADTDAFARRYAPVAGPQAAAGKIDAGQMPFAVDDADHGVKHNTDIFTQPDWQIESGQRFAERAIGDGAAFVHDDDVIGQPRYLVG